MKLFYDPKTLYLYALSKRTIASIHATYLSTLRLLYVIMCFAFRMSFGGKYEISYLGT